MIGKLEELTLLAALGAGEGSVPSKIYEHLTSGLGDGKAASFGAVYTTLTRMAAKGLLIQTRFTDDNGKSRFAFTVSPDGRSELNHSMASIQRMGGFALAGGF